MRNGDLMTTVPRHSKLKTGTTKAILDYCGISVDEAAREL